MPELPEVETVRHQLEARLTGAVLEDVTTSEVGRSLWKCGVDTEQGISVLEGSAVKGVRRRGKWLMVDLHRDGQQAVWVVHLGG